MKNNNNHFNSPLIGYLCSFIAIFLGIIIVPIAYALRNNIIGCAFLLTILHAGEFVALFFSFYFPYSFKKKNNFKIFNPIIFALVTIIIVVLLVLEAYMLAG